MKLTMEISNSTPFFYFLETIDYIAKKNWLEGDSGSMSMIMDLQAIWPYVADAYNPKEYPLKTPVPGLSDQFILITGDKIPLRNVARFKFKLHRMTGIIQLNFAGNGYKVVWGFQDGCLPTRFLEAHLVIHNERLKQNPKHRVLIHALPTNLVQKTYIDHLQNEFQFSYDIWNAMPAFASWAPEGIGLLTNKETEWRNFIKKIAQKFEKYRLVVLKYHGVLICGQDWDEMITLMESLDKAAANSMRLLKEEEYAIGPEFFKSLEISQNILFNPQVLEYGAMKKTEIFAPLTESELILVDSPFEKNQESLTDA